MGPAIPTPDGFTSCLGPESKLLPVTVNGVSVTDRVVDKCDTPSFLNNVTSCVPGGRITKWETTYKGQKVVTILNCRKSPTVFNDCLKRRPKSECLNDPTFYDVAMIQQNLSTNEVCWFQMLQPGGKPSNRIPIPQERTAHTYWEKPERTASLGCVGCHDSQLWLRTPYIVQADSDPGKRFVPFNPKHGRLKHLGDAFKSWNKDENQPMRIRIDSAAYIQANVKQENQAKLKEQIKDGTFASPNTCTRCHSIGKSPLATTKSMGTCNNLRFAAFGKIHVASTKIADNRKGFPHAFWMPPDLDTASIDTEKKYNRYMWYALDALDKCCKSPTLPFCKISETRDRSRATAPFSH